MAASPWQNCPACGAPLPPVDARDGQVAWCPVCNRLLGLPEDMPASRAGDSTIDQDGKTKGGDNPEATWRLLAGKEAGEPVSPEADSAAETRRLASDNAGNGEPASPFPTLDWASSEDKTEPLSQPHGERPAPPQGRVGRFHVVSILGHGAFGTVYRAFDPMLDREVALKVPR